MAITLAEANQIVGAAVAKAQEMGVRVTACVVDAGGGLIALNRMDGAPMSSEYGAIGKAKTSVTFGRSSAEIQQRAETPVTRTIMSVAGSDLVAWQGAVPIWRDGVLEGACGVGGASSEQDEDCARTGVAAAPGLKC